MFKTLVESIDVILSTQLTVEAEAQILVIKDHSKLDNLDYENSGHTGFVSKDYADTEFVKKVDKTDLYDANGTIKETLLPEKAKNVLEFDKQITGSTFMDQILESDIGSMVWIAADKTYTGDTYYRKFVINVDGSQANLILLDPKEQTIYICKTNSNCFRWSGTDIVEISKPIGLGETSLTAYAGDKGKSNADAITELQNSKMDRTDVIDYNNLNNKPIILVDLIPSEESNNVYQYTGNEEISGTKNGDLFKVKKEIITQERIIYSKYPNNLPASSLPIIIKNGFKIVFNSDYTSNLVVSPTMYNEENGINNFPQIQYAAGGTVYIIFNSSNESLKLHNTWNGGFVESFSNSYVTWDKSTRTLIYIGNEESVFNALTHYALGQAECTITTEENCEVITPYKFTYGKIEEYPDYTEVMNKKADKEYVDLKVPTPTTTPGIYKLQVVVDENGNPTYSWVVE